MKINVLIKNISKVSINVYEISLENYYKEIREEFDKNIVLDGLIPIEKQQYNYDTINAIRNHMEVF